MRKEDILDSLEFKKAPNEAVIKYVQADERCFPLGNVEKSDGKRKVIYWNASSCVAITKEELLRSVDFIRAPRSSEILVKFENYNRETWGCDFDYKDGVLYIRELV